MFVTITGSDDSKRCAILPDELSNKFIENYSYVNNSPNHQKGYYLFKLLSIVW